MLIGLYLFYQKMLKSLNSSLEGEREVKRGHHQLCVSQGSVVKDVIRIVYYLFF